MTKPRALIILIVCLLSVSLFVGLLARAGTAVAQDGQPVVLELSASGRDSDAPPAAMPEAPVNLVVDDGSAENAIGLTAGGQFIWLNRFTPAPADYPFCLNEIQVLFRSGDGINVSEVVDLYVYGDADGNPANGATHIASVTGVTVQALDVFSVYPTGGIAVSGPGDTLVAVVNRTAGTDPGEFPAAIDQTATQMRSWVGLYGGPPADPPTLPAPTFGTIDSFGFPGNWMVRGLGETGACLGGAAIAVSKSPDTQTVVSGGNANFTITVTNTGGITLTNVTVTDTLVPACNSAIGTLGVGATNTYNCTDVGVTNSYTNTAVAGGLGGQTPVSASDDALVTVVPPTSVSLSDFGATRVALWPLWLGGLVVAVLGAGVLLRRRRTV
ncbi:MAG: DUF11 domain-containing protein [Chloroflexi bacterium]|nr:DUF11 domain-containing protein [Chloroflexota bacterium]MCI0579178.1 DUF11 domain-containing protein [Chloroflexota bacterium]MCI0645257.1 DUF11 domain-containing protein [Chloroflexota bacterium]MCI0726761.1 DUF11 domain-containing protein [Chloroflexota bacterium]